MKRLLKFTLTIVFYTEISTGIECYECSDFYKNYECDSSHFTTGECFFNYKFCMTTYHESNLCGNASQKCVEKDCVGPEFCNETGSFTRLYKIQTEYSLLIVTKVTCAIVLTKCRYRQK